MIGVIDVVRLIGETDVVLQTAGIGEFTPETFLTVCDSPPPSIYRDRGRDRSRDRDFGGRRGGYGDRDRRGGGRFGDRRPERRERSTDITENMEIESDKVKYVIGRGGTKIRDIQYSCRVSVQIGTVQNMLFSLLI